MITQPTIKSSNTTATVNKSMAKTVAVQVSTDDTVVTLSKSGKTLEVPKSITKKQLKELDNYLSKHKNLTTQTISPNALTCGLYISYYWEFESEYQPVSGKLLGISNDLNIVTLQDAKKIYGFSLAAVNGFDNIASAKSAGFDYSNIMVAYLNPTTALATLQSNPNQYPKCGYYEIDEPLRYNFSYTDTKSLESLISSWGTGARVMITDYNWPTECCCNFWSKDAGAYLAYYQGVNYYMMCDQYGGNCCGSPCDFWDEYTNYYSPSHVISNWLDNVSAHYGLWDCCFKLANGSDQNINQIWLCAGNGDLGALQQFCYCAWSNGWLLQREDYIETVWECTTQPCTNCSFPTKGNWIVENVIDTGQYQYVGF